MPNQKIRVAIIGATAYTYLQPRTYGVEAILEF